MRKLRFNEVEWVVKVSDREQRHLWHRRVSDNTGIPLQGGGAESLTPSVGAVSHDSLPKGMMWEGGSPWHSRGAAWQTGRADITTLNLTRGKWPFTSVVLASKLGRPKKQGVWETSPDEAKETTECNVGSRNRERLVGKDEGNTNKRWSLVTSQEPAWVP